MSASYSHEHRSGQHYAPRGTKSTHNAHGQHNNRRSRRKRRKRIRLPARLSILTLIFLIAALFVIYQVFPVKESIKVAVGDTVKVEDFLKDPTRTASVMDGTGIFDTSKPGEYPVKVKCGLFTHDTTLIVEDREAPEFVKADDFTVMLGDPITYKEQVTVKDDCDKYPTVTVDSSGVNVTEIGTYPVVYTVTDKAGNSTKKKVNITIAEVTSEDQEVFDKADEILAGILTDDMSKEDKAWAIYEYIRSHVSYISHSEKGDYVRGARDGLIGGRGDCYVYFACAKMLLERAGIKNMDIERIPAKDGTMHYWNLVDLDDGHGWYHYDTTPRKDHPIIFLWNDAQTKEYSDTHEDCFNYDRSKYPEIP